MSLSTDEMDRITLQIEKIDDMILELLADPTNPEPDWTDQGRTMKMGSLMEGLVKMKDRLIAQRNQGARKCRVFVIDSDGPAWVQD